MKTSHFSKVSEYQFYSNFIFIPEKSSNYEKELKRQMKRSSWI
jgi:hypothetical protein